MPTHIVRSTIDYSKFEVEIKNQVIKNVEISKTLLDVFAIKPEY